MKLIFSKQTLALCGGLILLIGFFLGILSFLFFGDIAKNCKVLFVSKEALISLEQERTRGTTEELFFGKPEFAIKLISKILSSFEDKRTKILFISSETGAAKGGTDMSLLVHSRVIEEMNKEQLRGNR